MKRRGFIALLGGAALATPFAVCAQPQRRPARIGILTTAGTPKNALFGTFGEKLRELGYVEGQNLVIEFRSAGGNPDRR